MRFTGVPVTSSSYVWEDPSMSLEQLARVARDPIRIDQMPHLVPLEVYLSRDSLTDESGRLLMPWGVLREEAYDTVVMFRELSAGEEQFTFTFLHPGMHFLTVIADWNLDGLASAGNVTHRSLEVFVAPGRTGNVRAGELVLED